MALKDWIRQQFNGTGLCEKGHLPLGWQTPMAPKTFWVETPVMDPNHCTIIGGICSLATAESEAIRHGTLAFSNLTSFATWIARWYPRLDQVHNTVGLPPKAAVQVIYVCEDSLFAARVAAATRLPLEDLTEILRATHQRLGHPVIVNWLRNGGFQGLVQVVYTSELDRELETGLRIWENMLGTTFRPKERPTLKVGLMYTGLWPAILGIDGPVLIYEPVDHLTELPYYPAKVIDWLAQHPYGTGINHRLGAAGFVPYRDSQGVTRHLCLESVVNRSNWHDLSLPDSELPWATVNLLFPRRDVAKSGPEILAPAQARHLIRLQLHNLYDES